jgi:hypothetical protein
MTEFEIATREEDGCEKVEFRPRLAGHPSMIRPDIDDLEVDIFKTIGGVLTFGDEDTTFIFGLGETIDGKKVELAVNLLEWAGHTVIAT